MPAILANAKNFLYSSDYNIDQILGTYTGSFYSAAPTAITQRTISMIPVDTGITQTTFFSGVFSTDGGTTWQDFESQLPDFSAGVLAYQTITCSGASSPTGTFQITCNNYFNGTTNTGTAYTVQWKLVLYARPGQQPLTVQPIGSNFFLNSDINYQKICVDDSKTLSATSSLSGNVIAVATFPHNLGYIPKIRGFFDNSTDTGNMTQQNLYTLNVTNSDKNKGGWVTYYATVDTTNAYINAFIPQEVSPSTATYSANVYMRVYYDS